MCYLRSEGLAHEAQVIEETEFAEAAAQARAAAGSASEGDARMAELLGEEEQRVADAVALAEVLVPILAQRLAALVPSPHIAAPAAAARERKPLVDAHRGIADFIEDMLAQERTTTR